MSMMSNSGSSAAAEDVMHYIQKLIDELGLQEDSEGYRVAMKIYLHSYEIKDCADKGWY